MPSSQITRTPVPIQQAWNDGLFVLREKRNGLARGTSIEEKVMYVLGLGWKIGGGHEVKDNIIRDTLYVSLDGLTPDSKFLKIGQVLWEQCDENFILKMISSLSTNNPASVRMYRQIENKEQQNFRGYFSKAVVKSMKKNSISGNNILNRESKQMSSNSKINTSYKRNLAGAKRDLASSKLNSKGFGKKLVKFKTSNSEIKVLANELEVVLKTIFSDQVADIAISLGINVESGFNKNYLIEAIKSNVAGYVEGELLIGRSSNSNNVYLRQTPEGLDTIEDLLRYTSFAYLTFKGVMSVADLKAIDEKIALMKSKMGDIKSSKFKSKKLDKKIAKRDRYLDRVQKRENRSRGKKIDKRSKFRFKPSMSEKLFKLFEKVSPDNDSITFTGSSVTVYKNENAVKEWIKAQKDEFSMASAIVSADSEGSFVLHKLNFTKMSNVQLLESLINLVQSMGIPKENYPITDKDGFGMNTPEFYMAIILRRFVSLAKESKTNILSNTLSLGINSKRKKGMFSDIIDKIGDNFKEGVGKNDKFAKLANGSFAPLSIEPDKLAELSRNPQGVYVVGGSIYSFGNGSFASDSDSKTSLPTSSIRTDRKNISRMFVGGDARQKAFTKSSSNFDMGAFGTQEEMLVRGDDENKTTFIQRVVESKMMPELQKIGMGVNSKVQPVFLVNQGINTSNIETTALLNLLPSILEFIPGFGTAAGMALGSLLQGEVDAAKSLPKFAVGGSFTTKNSNISQFISGDSINNKINPEKVTIDWATQRVNVQPINTTNNVTNVETGRITDPIMGTSTTVTVADKSGKNTSAMSVYNAVNPFDEDLTSGAVTASPMDVLVSLKESLVDILVTLSAGNQTGQMNASMTAKVVDAINSLNNNMNQSAPSGVSNIFGPIGQLARGE